MEPIRGNHPDARVGEEFYRRGCSLHALFWCLRQFDLPSTDHPIFRFKSEVGPDAADCIALAEHIERRLRDGSIGGYITSRNAEIAAHPLVECTMCVGAGKPTNKVGAEVALLDDASGLVMVAENDAVGCRFCGGRGKVENTDSHRQLYASDLREFAEFLRHCGGFFLVGD